MLFVAMSGFASSAVAQDETALVVVQIAPGDEVDRGAVESAVTMELARRGVDATDPGAVRAALHFQFEDVLPTSPDELDRLRAAVGATRWVLVRIDADGSNWQVAITDATAGASVSAFGELAPHGLDQLAGILDRLPLTRSLAAPAPSPPPSTQAVVVPPPRIEVLAAGQPAMPAETAAPVAPGLAATTSTYGEEDSVAPTSDPASPPVPAPAAVSSTLDAHPPNPASSHLILALTAGTGGWGYGLSARGDVGLARLPGPFAHAISLDLDLSWTYDYGSEQLTTYAFVPTAGASVAWRVVLSTLETWLRGGIALAFPYTWQSGGSWNVEVWARGLVGCAVALHVGPVSPLVALDAYFGAGESFVLSIGMVLE